MNLDPGKQKTINQVDDFADSRSLPILTKGQLIARALEAEKQ